MRIISCVTSANSNSPYGQARDLPNVAHFLAWCVERQIELVHIQPGKPRQNARVESFHGRLREECLAVSWFQNLFDARREIAAWQIEYNEERPHSSLGYRTPKEFAAAHAAGFYTAEQGARDSSAVPRPRAPQSRLKTEMAQQKVVVFLRERKPGGTKRYRQNTFQFLGSGEWGLTSDFQTFATTRCILR
jgi:integrase-like protein